MSKDPLRHLDTRVFSVDLSARSSRIVSGARISWQAETPNVLRPDQQADQPQRTFPLFIALELRAKPECDNFQLEAIEIKMDYGFKLLNAFRPHCEGFESHYDAGAPQRELQSESIR